jgi:hypothetical protein
MQSITWQEFKMATPQEKAVCVDWFIETKADIQVQLPIFKCISERTHHPVTALGHGV